MVQNPSDQLPIDTNERAFYEALTRMDNKAFTLLYTRVYSACIRYACTNSGTPDDALDHLHKVLELFILNLKTGRYAYQPSTKVSTYFISVFIKSWLKNVSRPALAIGRLPYDIDLLDDQPTQEYQELVGQAFTQLKSNCQTIIAFYYQEELSIAQLAERMKLTPKSAKNQLSRCRMYFKSHYKALLGRQS